MSTFVHMELNTSDVDGAKKFYKGVLGWKFKKVPTPDGKTYTMIEGPNGTIGGVQDNPTPGAPSHWLGYVGVASVKRTVAKVTKRGGKVLFGPIDMPGMGSLAIFADPQGAAFGVWQEAAPAPAQTAQQAKKAGKKAAKKAAKKAGKKAAKKVAKKAAKKAGKKTVKKVAKKAAKKVAKKATKKKTAQRKAKR